MPSSKENWDRICPLSRPGPGTQPWTQEAGPVSLGPRGLRMTGNLIL